MEGDSARRHPPERPEAEADVTSTYIRIVREWSELAPHRAAWNQLALRSSTSSVFQTFEWHDAWWAAFGSKTGTLSVALLFDDERLAAIAPLHRYRRGRRTVVGFIGNSNSASDYCDFITDRPALVQPMLDELLEHGAWDVLDLGNVPAESSCLRAASEWARVRRRSTIDIRQFPAPTRILGDVEEDRACLNKKSLKRHFNGFAKSGSLRFHHSTDPAEIDARLDDFFRQHAERWALSGRASQFAEPEQRDFYRRLVPALLANDWLRFGIVALDERPIAYHFGFEYANRFIWYKPTFEASLVKKSPGEVLLRFLLEDAMSRGLAEFDFTVGDEDFKYRFANLVRETRRLRVYRRTRAQRADRVEAWLRRRARQALNRLQRKRERRPEAAPPSEAPAGAGSTA